jgi:L-malate glycosyltransferase
MTSTVPGLPPELKDCRVLMVARQGHITEAEQMCRLRARGLDVRAVVEPDSRNLALLEEQGVPVSTMRLRSHVDLRAIRVFRRRIRKEGLTILHALANRPLSNLLWASLGLPVKVVGYRGAVGHVHRFDPGCWLKWYHPRLDRIVCVSEAVRQDLLRSGVQPEKLVTIFKGHDLDWYRDLARPDLPALGIPGSAFVVGCAANMRRVKGVDVLIRALAHIPAALEVHLLLIGEVRDPLVARLAADPRWSQRVHLVGFRKDAVALLGACHVACAPSRGREGLTRAIIEAMAQGVPVVVTRAGGLPEMVEDGLSGFIVDVDDAAMLADRIVRLAKDPELRQRMGRAARLRQETMFHVDTTVDRTLALYKDLLANTRG